MGLCGEEERWPGQGRVPLPPSPNRTRREGVGAPLLLSLFSHLRILFQLGKGGSPTPTGSRTPPFLVGVGKRKGEGERRKGAPPSLVQFGLVHGEGCGHPLGPFSPFPYGPLRPNTNSRNSLVLRKIAESLGTFPMSEYSCPIYRYLRLDHFETPRQVPDLIRDSELLRYIKTHKLII